MEEETFVFISYSRRDSTFVEKLQKDLNRSGVHTWRDVNEILPGQNWENEIGYAVYRAEVLLFVSSRNSVESAWMSYELQAAVHAGTRVIPVIIDNDGAQKLPIDLQQFQWVDFRENYDTAFQQLISSLPKLVRMEAPIMQQVQKSKGYVFLSYAEEDAKFVEKLKKFLSRREFAYWDYRESSRNYHQLLALELEGIINESVATLSVLSPDWKRSEWAIREYFYSNDAGIPVFLLKAKDPGPTLAIAGMPFIDFTQSEKDGYDKLKRELIRKGL